LIRREGPGIPASNFLRSRGLVNGFMPFDLGMPAKCFGAGWRILHAQWHVLHIEALALHLE
jgi:hypothetical protein